MARKEALLNLRAILVRRRDALRSALTDANAALEAGHAPRLAKEGEG
jgi:hypothetical protein